MRPPILVIDDQVAVLERVNRLLSEQYEVFVREDAATILEDFERLGDPIVVLDISLIGMNGFTAARILISRHPKARIVFLSGHWGHAYVAAAFDAGGIGYVLKTSAPKDLGSAIEAAIRGDEFVSSGLSFH